MGAKLKKLVVILALTVIFLSFAQANMEMAFSGADSGEIDLFTQKEPHNGKGLNVPSDAFAPGEVVILYASVTRDETPLQSILVTFYIESPDNASFSLAAETNATGIATITFTIPTPTQSINETGVFGEWFTLANVLVGIDFVQDTLTFNVDWIVNLISVRTIDENLMDRIDFGVGGEVGLEVTLRNIAMTLKGTWLAIVIQDELNYLISSLYIDDFEVQPHGKSIFLYCKLSIAKLANIGNATVIVSALTAPADQGGVPCCPPVSTVFRVHLYEPITVTFHDAAIVEATPSVTLVGSGQPLTVSVTVRNEGTEVESFNVTVLCNDILIGIMEAPSLTPYSCTTLNFTLDTSMIALGNHTITVSIPYLTNEADLTDNFLVDGVIEIVRPEKLYYLSVRTEPPGLISISGEGWYKMDTDVTLTAPHHIFVSMETRYQFSYWDIDGTSMPSNSITVTMDTNHSAVAHYNIQYYLEVTSLYGTPSGEDWYDANTTAYAILNTGIVLPGNRTRRIFVGWSGDASGTNYSQSNPILMDQPKAATANWITQYEVAFDLSGIDSPSSGGILIVDDFDRTSDELPYSIWVNTGTVITYSYLDSSSMTPGKRFLLISVTGPLSPISVLTPVTVVGNYRIQHYLTVKTDPVGIITIPGEGWYDQYENVTLTASIIDEYDFGYWDIDGASQSIGTETITVHMDNPHTATAHYSLPGEGWRVLDWFFWFVLLILLATFGILFVWAYRRKRRKRDKEAFRSGWTAWYYCYDLRNRTPKTKI